MEMVDNDNHKHSTSTIAFTANLENESASTDIAIRFTSRYVWRISKNAFFCSMFIIGVATTLLSVVNLLALIFIRGGHHYGENGRTNDHLPCGTWKAYSDLKCIKVIDQMETYDKAVELCKKADPSATLLVIHTKDEQAFMGKYLFVKERLFNSVWLGERMKSIGGRATYADDNDLELVYTNWEKRHPKEGTGQICSQMQPDPDPDHNSNFMVDHGYRKWISVRCEAKGAVVCQRFQNWSPARFQTTMMRTLVEVERLRKALDDVIPEGFTYLQLPEEEPPNHLWPNLIFRDFTYQFPSGHFLRVINHTEGQAQEYFTLQLEDQMPESSPRLTEVRITTTTANSSTASSYLSSAKITPGEWSSVALTTMQSQPLSLNYSQYLVNNSSGQTNKMQQTNLQFLVEKAEVRPKSLAVKIWRRCKSKL